MSNGLIYLFLLYLNNMDGHIHHTLSSIFECLLYLFFHLFGHQYVVYDALELHPYLSELSDMRLWNHLIL